MAIHYVSILFALVSVCTWHTTYLHALSYTADTADPINSRNEGVSQWKLSQSSSS